MTELTTGLFAGILLAHFLGDYVLQTNWMATEKLHRWAPAIVHGLCYTIPYVFVTQSPLALFVIGSTHIVIDRYRLARHLIWFKNWFAPKAFRTPWRNADGVVTKTGYQEGMPPFMAVWLVIITDNGMHLIINTLSVIYL